MKFGDLLAMLLGIAVMTIFARWLHRALTAYPGISATTALSIEAGECLSRWGNGLQTVGRKRLNEER